MIDECRKKLDAAGLKYAEDDKDRLVILRIENIGALRIYKKKKGTTIDYSQIPEHFKQRIMDIIEPLAIEKVLGIDESGKGDFFGPLVAAGVFAINPSELRALGVMDSKKLTDEKIIRLAEKIKKKCFYNIVKINPERYNSLYDDLKNLNSLLAWAHAKVIENSLDKVIPDYVLSDKFADDKVLSSMLGEKGKKIRLVQKIKAESNISVAAASIIARAEFVLSLQQLSFKYGMELPLGAGDNVVKAAKKFVKKYSKDELIKIAKMHFKTSSLC